MEKKRKEKIAMRELIKKEMRLKEKAGMEYYHAAINIKYELK